MDTQRKIAETLRAEYQGKGIVPDARLEEMCKSTEDGKATPYDGTANVISLLFYVNVMVHLYKPSTDIYCKLFTGNAGSMSVPGDSLFGAGTLYACGSYTAEDIFAKTTRFSGFVVSIPVAAGTIYFYDKYGNTLGYYHGGGAGTVSGSFAGSGHWEDG